MGGRYRRAQVGGEQYTGCGAGFGTKSATWLQAREASAHGAYDAPSTAERSERDRRVAGHQNPRWHIEGRDQLGSEQHAGDDASRFLRVVGAVRKTEGCRRYEL